jgi:tRNA uridine 5-carbamoylmethylation protein Kti12
MDSPPPVRARFIVILSGPPAVGKNAIARHVCSNFPKTLAEIDLDKVKGFVASDPRTDYFLDLAEEISLSMVRIYLKANMSVVVYNAFCHYKFVHPFVLIADEMKVPTWYFKLTAPLEELLKRDRARTTPAEESEVRRIYAFDQACKHPEGIEIDTMKFGAEEAARLIMRNISGCQDIIQTEWNTR